MAKGKAGQAAKDAETTRSKIDSVMAAFNAIYKGKPKGEPVQITVPKGAVRAGKSATETLTVTQEALGLVCKTIADPSFTDKPEEKEGMTTAERTAYNKRLQEANAARKAIRLFHAIPSMPKTSLPPMPTRGATAKSATVGEVSDADQFLSELGIELE